MQKQRSFGQEGPGGSGLSIANKVKRGDIRHAVVVRAHKEQQRKDGSYIRFDDNACVLINKSGDPIGTRLTGESAIEAAGTLSPRDMLMMQRCRGRRTARQEVVQDTLAGTAPCITLYDERTMKN